MENNNVNVPELVRLLNEMQKAAKENVLKAIPIENNLLSVMAICFQRDHIQQKYFLHIKFELNDKEYELSMSFPADQVDDLARLDQTMVLDALTDKISKAIAERIVKESFNHFLTELYKNNRRQFL